MLPYVFVGDEVFTLREDFMKLYNVQQLTKERRIFNYRLSHARRITENVFGIPEQRLGIFKTHIKIQLICACPKEQPQRKTTLLRT